MLNSLCTAEASKGAKYFECILERDLDVADVNNKFKDREHNLRMLVNK